MQRTNNLETVKARTEPWDIVVIGGGATGAGCALDAASRGYSVLLLERHDFGKGTSSRSTKLIHGGVRYLRQGNISLVREALQERATLLKNAPHVVGVSEFIIPCYGVWEKLFYGVGMKVYDLMAGKFRIGASRILDRDETLERMPGINTEGLSGGVLYHDGQFDDSRLLIDIIRTAVSHGAAVLNYADVRSFSKDASGSICGVDFVDLETGEQIAVNARSVINATGVFSDEVAKLADEGSASVLTFAQGVHIVFDKQFLASNDALMIPKTSDGRVLFCIPWHEHLLVGTTDTPIPLAEIEPAALDSEIDFILETAGEFLVRKPSRTDILSVFAGIRPLIGKRGTSRTASLSRGHELFVDRSGMVTITGGKWTTYRRMAELAVDKAANVGDLDGHPSVTKTLQISPPERLDEGSALHPRLPYTREHILRAVRSEMARTVEDVLARRTRALFLDARAAAEMAEEVAGILARELGWNEMRRQHEIRDFKRLAENYLPRPI